MVEHINFYENMKEAQMRLVNTVVLYDGEPYHLLAIGNNKNDGIFRVYMEPTGNPKGNFYQYADHGLPSGNPDDKIRGDELDKFIESYPQYGIIRKQMNSPLFNRFRPFPLGMCNYRGSAYYLERQPCRHTQQGLTDNMVKTRPVSLNPDSNKCPAIGVTWVEMRRTIMNDYPSFNDCVKNVLSEDYLNKSAAFHREFAVLVGPVDTVFLQYRTEVIGIVPNHDNTSVVLSKEFEYAKEVVEELNLFESIKIK